MSNFLVHYECTYVENNLFSVCVFNQMFNPFSEVTTHHAMQGPCLTYRKFTTRSLLKFAHCCRCCSHSANAKCSSSNRCLQRKNRNKWKRETLQMSFWPELDEGWIVLSCSFTLFKNINIGNRQLFRKPSRWFSLRTLTAKEKVVFFSKRLRGRYGQLRHCLFCKKLLS